MMEAGDLQVKYQKIAAEYSKLRAQASVLKKAVVEEQGRNTELRNVLREREQSLRKSTQEMESLTFRNQQLTKRVTVLQDELEAREARPKKGKLKSTENNFEDSSRSVIGEELQMKIAENVRLVTTIHDNEAAYQQQIAALNERVETLEYDLLKVNKENVDSEKKYRSLIFKLENDKGLLKGFGDSSDSLADIVSIVESGDGVDCGATGVMARAGVHVKDLAAAFSAYHLTTEQRVHCTQVPVSPASSKFSSCLKEGGLLVQDIEREYSELQASVERANNSLSVDVMPALQSFSARLTAYTNHLHKLVPYHQLSLEEEVSHDARVATLNNEIELQLKSVTSHFFKLNSYVKLFSVQGKRWQQQSASSQRRFLSELTDGVRSLLDAMRGLACAHAAKASMLADLGDTSDRLRTCDERLCKAVDNMVNATEKLLKILLDHRLVSSATPVPANGSSAFHESEPEDSTETEDPVASTSGVGSRETLLKQLETCRLKAVKLEQDKEHWHLEYKLLHMKHEKRTQELEEQLVLLKGASETVTEGQTQENNSYGPATTTNLLGRLDAPFALTAEMEAREHEVKSYLTRRMDHLLEQRQVQETKATTLATECAVLQRRLELSASAKRQGDSRLREASDRAARLHEELQTTAHNYETQLSTMSEHLANLNDTLTLQRDQIEQLKYQLDGKSSRKGKQK